MSFLSRFLPDPPKDDMLAGVVRNLTHLLSSRREYGSLLCSFGMADYLAEHNARSAVMTMIREIEETIELYEPRLRVESIRALGSDHALWVYIEVRGVLMLPTWGAACCLIIKCHVPTGAVTVEAIDGS